MYEPGRAEYEPGQRVLIAGPAQLPASLRGFTGQSGVLAWPAWKRYDWDVYLDDKSIRNVLPVYEREICPEEGPW